jgi:hypothetical protein
MLRDAKEPAGEVATPIATKSTQRLQEDLAGGVLSRLAVAELQVAVAVDGLDVAQVEERERLRVRQRSCYQHGVVGTGIKAGCRIDCSSWWLSNPQHHRAPRSIVP